MESQPGLSLSRRYLLLGCLPAACGMVQSRVDTVASIDALLALPTAGLPSGTEVDVSDTQRGGRFRWDPGSRADADGGIIFESRSGSKGRWVRRVEAAINVLWFGASATAGALQNSRAFSAASAALSRAGGGGLLVPPGVYEVGYQPARRGPTDQGFLDIIRVERCAAPVTISGKGATLRAARGLKFGSFHPASRARHSPRAMPFVDLAYRVDAYRMIYVRQCSGPVTIEGFDLDGNMANYELGGEWGDKGRQVTAVGIMLEDNSGGVRITGVKSHDHGLDGIMVAHYGLTAASPRYPVTLTDVSCDRNGRQGLSWIGGTELTAIRCRFTRTGKGRFGSAPGAGVDVEAESSICRNGRFVECEFSDNAGAGFLAEAGDAADISLERCKFVGTTSWSAWPRKPGIVFRECTFVGSIVQTYWDKDAARAARFLSCRFVADPKLSPTGEIYGPYLADLGAGATNVLFGNCQFDAISPAVALPWSPADVRYDNCRFRQTSTAVCHPRGVYTGTCRIDSPGPVDLDGSRILGTVILNGKKLG